MSEEGRPQMLRIVENGSVPSFRVYNPNRDKNRTVLCTASSSTISTRNGQTRFLQVPSLRPLVTITMCKAEDVPARRQGDTNSAARPAMKNLSDLLGLVQHAASDLQGRAEEPRPDYWSRNPGLVDLLGVINNVSADLVCRAAIADLDLSPEELLESSSSQTEKTSDDILDMKPPASVVKRKQASDFGLDKRPRLTAEFMNMKNQQHSASPARALVNS